MQWQVLILIAKPVHENLNKKYDNQFNFFLTKSTN